MDTNLFLILGFGAPVVAGAFAVWQMIAIDRMDPGNETMRRIAATIQAGAMAFLRVEYTTLLVFVVLMFAAIALFLPNAGLPTAWSFLAGAGCSALAGWIGMRTATNAGVRTTQAARDGLGAALRVAFSAGAVMGMTVVALGLAGITALYVAFGGLDGNGLAASQNIFGFSLGASSIALFARVGGGIFTKAADVAGDLSGKVEAGIPEDDPRNPAAIADSVGDNVGDVAGMGADLFESYVGGIISAMALAWAMSADTALRVFGLDPVAFAVIQPKLVLFPVLLSGTGILASVAATFSVRTNREDKLHGALFTGIVTASVLVMAGAWGLVTWMGLPMKVFYALAAGLLTGAIIGKITEYYTSAGYSPVRHLAAQSTTGAATTIISGMALGMVSCGLPVLVISIAIFFAFQWSGLYGIAIAAVGMLATLGISLGIDAYGPVADNAGGIAQMSHLDEEVRRRTDALDSVGNTTAAIGKGLAIGSAALTALALFSTFRKLAADAISAAGGPEAFSANQISYELDNPNVLLGLLVGGTLPFLFSAMTMNAVSRSAAKMIVEVRRQFREIPGLIEGNALPDSATCVAISTKAAIQEMVLPGLMAVFSPLICGYVLGVSGLGGLLTGALVTGVLIALMMANAGGAWDNAKKYIEEGNHGGKGSESHKAAVIGDTVGDPFKDTAGPSLNILIKLMSIVALVFVPLIVQWIRN